MSDKSYWQQFKNEVYEDPSRALMIGLWVGGGIIGPVYDYEAGLVMVIIGFGVLIWKIFGK